MYVFFISNCLQTWYQQHNVNAPSILPYCAEGCYPHLLGRKSPSSLRILRNFFTNHNGAFHVTAIYNPKGSCIGKSKSQILAFHLLVEIQIWKLGKHEHIDTANNLKPGRRGQGRNDIPYFYLSTLFKDASLKDTNTHQHTELKAEVVQKHATQF